MSAIGFPPWIGSKYRDRGVLKKRTLVLGESYYETVQLPPDPTNDFIAAQIDRQKAWPARKARFYTSIVRAFLKLDRRPTFEEKSAFWNSVCHYTFVQEPVGHKSRIRPTSKLWEDGQAPFLETIKQWQPEFIIVMGRELWRHLPPAIEPGPAVVSAKYKETVRYQVRAGAHALAYGINHPSSGRFSVQRMHADIMNAMEFAETFPFLEITLSNV